MLVAWDPVTQKERWRNNGGGSTGGGTVTTAGNLVFQVVPDGRFVAYSADKGEKLLDIQFALANVVGVHRDKMRAPDAKAVGKLPRP